MNLSKTTWRHDHVDGFSRNLEWCAVIGGDFNLCGGIPGAVVIALMRQVKGPIELAHEPTVSAVKHTAWHDQRYAHD